MLPAIILYVGFQLGFEHYTPCIALHGVIRRKPSLFFARPYHEAEALFSI